MYMDQPFDTTQDRQLQNLSRGSEATLRDYITQARQAGKDNDQIRQELLDTGWQEDAINQHLQAFSVDSASSIDLLEKELREHKSLDQEHIALDKKHIIIDQEHITADKKHKKFDRWITVGSILAISLAGTALVFLEEYQLQVSEYQLRTNEAEQKLTQQEEKTAGQEQKLTQQQREVDSLKKIAVDIPAIIKEWEPRMAVIVCQWDYIPRVQSATEWRGSGLLVRVTLPRGAIVYDLYTNKHVIKDQGYTPNRCIFGFPPDFKPHTVENDNTNFLWSEVEDWGIIKLSEDADIISRAASQVKVCKHPIALGERILVLGYPVVGSEGSVTSTQGIVSGHEGNYYVTDAKMEHGGSGGAAISLRSDCYLGIPTKGLSGTAETFGRILRSDAFMPSKQ